ncbi:MAG: NAC domain-containing protein, partial [Candidatus Bathyarchaeia archaeon]
MHRLSGREARRMMERMGIGASEIADVKQVLIKASNREIILENPTVTALEVQGQKLFQIVAEKIEERTPTTTTPSEAKAVIPEEDVQLVALQANV